MFRGADAITPWGVQDGKVNNGSQFNITYHFSQNLSWVRGRHEYKMGGEIRRTQTTAGPLDLAGSNGQYYFNRPRRRFRRTWLALDMPLRACCWERQMRRTGRRYR